MLAQELSSRKFSYPRTDGSQWTLSLKDVIDRIGDLEMAYNVNDCVELRWGAPEGSEEAATCKRRAPQGQRAKMTDYRAVVQRAAAAAADVSRGGGTIVRLPGLAGQMKTLFIIGVLVGCCGTAAAQGFTLGGSGREHPYPNNPQYEYPPENMPPGKVHRRCPRDTAPYQGRCRKIRWLAP